MSTRKIETFTVSKKNYTDVKRIVTWCSAYILQLNGDFLDLSHQLGLGLLQAAVLHSQLLAVVFQLGDTEGQFTPGKYKKVKRDRINGLSFAPLDYLYTFSSP